MSQRVGRSVSINAAPHRHALASFVASTWAWQGRGDPFARALGECGFVWSHIVCTWGAFQRGGQHAGRSRGCIVTGLPDSRWLYLSKCYPCALVVRFRGVMSVILMEGHHRMLCTALVPTGGLRGRRCGAAYFVLLHGENGSHGRGGSGAARRKGGRCYDGPLDCRWPPPHARKLLQTHARVCAAAWDRPQKLAQGPGHCATQGIGQHVLLP